MAKKTTGLSKKDQQKIEKALTDGYNSLSDTGKRITTILLLIVLLAGAVWYFMFDGKATVDEWLGNGQATTAVEVLPYGPEGTYDPTAWDEQGAPNYYRLAGSAVITHPEVLIGEIQYGELDSYGRATWACGVITPAMYHEELAEDREGNLPNPAGWPKGRNYKVDITLCNGEIYHGEMFNRSHMVADSLGGAATKNNLVTGTRMQNTGSNNQSSSGYGGMAYTEDKVRKYLKSALKSNQDVTVYYCVTPVYLNDELLPRSVYVDVKSSDGKLDMHVETFNCARGYEINYYSAAFSEVQ